MATGWQSLRGCLRIHLGRRPLSSSFPRTPFHRIEEFDLERWKMMAAELGLTADDRRQIACDIAHYKEMEEVMQRAIVERMLFAQRLTALRQANEELLNRPSGNA